METILIGELKNYVRVVSEQAPYNLLDRRIENELVPMCQAYGLAVLPWSPMAMGILAGRYAEGAEYPPDSRAHLRGGIYAERVTPRAVEVGNRFVQLAKNNNISAAQLALLWAKDGDVLRFLSKKNDVWFPKLKPVPVMGTEKENHTSWERYYRVSDCSSSSRNDWYLGR